MNRIETICKAMEPVWPVMWDAEMPAWPLGMCTVTSLLLAPLLRASVEADFVVVIGTVDGRHHCWVETGEIIVDPTYGQFVEGEPALLICSTDDDYGHHAHTRLSLEDEDNYRSTIRPQSWRGGTSAASAIRADFWDVPAHDIAEVRA